MPLIGHLSNPELLNVIDQQLNANMAAIPVKVKRPACRCGCGQPAASGCKFVDQTHYDNSKGLSAADAERLMARFRQGVPVLQLAREIGVAHTTVYRLLRKNGLS